MSEIIKINAIVLRKIEFGDTSRIAHFFTEEYGKISAIIKGARTAKSKTGMLIDTMNLLQIVLYRKETREIQIVSDVDLIRHYSKIREDLDRIKYASAVIELLLNLTFENEQNKKLFSGTVKILGMLDEFSTDPKLLFAKYFLFFLRETGYYFQVRDCNVCGREIKTDRSVSYSYDSGIVCDECSRSRLTNFEISKELFNLLYCLNSKAENVKYSQGDLDLVIRMLEKFLMYHVNEFHGIRSLQMI
jgi:DNA repair protein RecO (recombination protein O)